MRDTEINPFYNINFLFINTDISIFVFFIWKYLILIDCMTVKSDLKLLLILHLLIFNNNCN
jgi:hypothetical protein